MVSTVVLPKFIVCENNGLNSGGTRSVCVEMLQAEVLQCGGFVNMACLAISTIEKEHIRQIQ